MCPVFTGSKDSSPTIAYSVLTTETNAMTHELHLVSKTGHWMWIPLSEIVTVLQ